MTVKLDFEECLKDSPRFRAAIEGVESDVFELETRLEKLLKLCGAMLDSGRQYCMASKAFVGGVRELSQHTQGDTMMSECLEKFSVSLNQMLDNQVELLDSTQQSSRHHIYILVKEDMKRFKEARKEFERGSEGLASALHHNAEVPRRKQHEVEEAVQALQSARTSARHRALDYVLQINMIQFKKKFEILQFMTELMDAQACCLEQGHRLAQQLEKYRKELGDQLHQLVLESAREKRDMEQRHIMIKQTDLSQDEAVLEGRREAPDGVVMEGYLYKRASNAFKTWSRRWFSIQSNQLVYQKRAKDPLTVVVEDLRLCTVKPCPDHERRFCFEVVSPSKSCLLQADSERHQQAWLTAVQNSIASAFSEGQAEPPGQHPERPASLGGGTMEASGRSLRAGGDKRVLDQVQRLEGNAQCCDCREPAPEWASINLGITLCIECSGIHRSLGVHFSKVRSLTLDSWEPELVKLMCELGNGALNRIYEARVDEMTVKRPQPGCSRAEKESWIRAKYVEKKFITKLPEARLSRGGRRGPLDRDRPPRPPLKPQAGSIGRAAEPGEAGSPPEDLRSLHPGALLFCAAGHQNLPTMADALAHGADVNWVNAAEDSRTPLLQAVAANSLLACEFLLQNGANVNQADSAGRGPLHHATILGHTGLACLFLKRGANLNAVDVEGKEPLSIAIDTANADIVTLLRLAKMREAEVAQGQSGDETYLDIFRDFSLMASDNPEKLTRRDLKLTTL
ncbi:arf-GAP with coiled-coil, ANK repeat and PH domain-containing protein 1 isoform X2 [Dermochelys coriacea]|uniref:arf-GAP with coiled-coil, ANK repeat and PH domain-containing protein 1 isoform X2 n=1 Tax=Dermochelys coriacea TaxID=27794 RepID=UPI001CA9029A|nr:arf-GAP with coiled-coil, ANK repeat and PH domain-containing protein 1 isoform X2 [Dermochelys coriacea]